MSGTAVYYLLPFDTPYLHALHYLRNIGPAAANDVATRMAEHRAGRGARILASCVRQGIRFNVVRTWQRPSATSNGRALPRRGPAVLRPGASSG